MSTPRLVLLLIAVVLTTTSIAALVAGIISGLISPGILVVGLMMCTIVTWSAWARAGRFEHLAKQTRIERALGRLDDEPAQARPVRPVR